MYRLGGLRTRSKPSHAVQQVLVVPGDSQEQLPRMLHLRQTLGLSCKYLFTMRLHLFNGSLDFEVCREKSRGSSFRSSRRFPRVVLFGVPIVTDLGFPRFFTTRPSVRKSGIQTRSPGDSCSPSTILCL